MMTMNHLAAVAFAGFLAAPLSAQIVVREDPSGTRSPRPRVEEGSGASSRSRVDARTGEARRTSSRIPPGHLPPQGMCRVWIDGVPPGRQPAVTDCVTAELNRVASSRVIYGDRESFPGKGKGKFKNRERNRDEDDRGRNKLSKAEKRATQGARKANRDRDD